MAEEKKTQVEAEEKAAAEEKKKDTESSVKEAPAEAGEKASEEKTEEKKEEASAGSEEKVAEETADEEKAKVESPKVELSGKMGDIIETIEKLSVLELSELVKAMEDRFGVSAQAPVAVAGVAAGAAAGGGDAAEEEKSLFTVELSDVGAKKINVIKEVRALTDLGLKEAKELVESAPCTVKADLLKDEAEKMKKQLEDAGAKVELK